MHDSSAEQQVRAPRAGEIVRNPSLAQTLRTLATEGKRGFYTGRIAQAIVDVVQSKDGKMDLSDLGGHLEAGAQESRAISLKFSGFGAGGQSIQDSRGPKYVELWEHLSNSQGIVALMALGILQELEATGKVAPFNPEEHNKWSLPPRRHRSSSDRLCGCHLVGYRH